jgi:hypothetical protein
MILLACEKTGIYRTALAAVQRALASTRRSLRDPRPSGPVAALSCWNGVTRTWLLSSHAVKYEAFATLSIQNLHHYGAKSQV